MMTRSALLLSLLLVAASATAEPPATKAPAKAVVAKAPSKAAPTKAVTKAPPIVKAEIKAVVAAPTSAPAVAPASAPASQPASAPASQKVDVPKDTAGAVSAGQQFIRDLQHKDWRHAAAVLLMLLIFIWRRYGEKFLALHKVPDRYLGFITAGVAVLYALGLALGTKGVFDWSAFISNAIISAGESMLAWEVAGKFLLEKTLGPTPAKTRRRAAHAASRAALPPSAPADANLKIEDDKPTEKPAADDGKSA